MAKIRYQEFFTAIMGRKLDFDREKDKYVATCLNIFFSDRNDYVIYNGRGVVNIDFYSSLTNSKTKSFSNTDAKVAEYIRKTLASRRYSSEQKDRLVGYMSVARKMSFRNDENFLIYEIKSMSDDVFANKSDVVNSTLVTDGVRVCKDIERTFFNKSISSSREK